MVKPSSRRTGVHTGYAALNELPLLVKRRPPEDRQKAIDVLSYLNKLYRYYDMGPIRCPRKQPNSCSLTILNPRSDTRARQICSNRRISGQTEGIFVDRRLGTKKESFNPTTK